MGISSDGSKVSEDAGLAIVGMSGDGSKVWEDAGLGIECFGRVGITNRSEAVDLEGVLESSTSTVICTNEEEEACCG